MQALPNPGGHMAADYAQPTAALPFLSFDDGDPTEIDYLAYLQDQIETDALADSSSGDATTPFASTSPSSATLSDWSAQPLTPRPPQLAPSTALALHGRGNAAGRKSSSSPEAQLVPPKQRLERRGHTKSRRGCFNCKRRRIKCQETRPACGHCVKQGLKCEYPALPTIVHQPQHQVPLFSLQDMRFFQHFLLVCYPHHPIGSEDLWTHEIPCLSQKYEYLMHAILGYSASELLVTDASLAEAAMAHRLKALKAIKKALADVRSEDMFEEGNALMATCLALTYQSVLLDDGIAEYMTFIRGVVIVAVQMYVKGAKMLFGPLMDDDRTKETLEPHMRKLPLIEKAWTDGAVASIEGLGPLVQGVEGSEAQRRYWELLLEMARSLYASSWEAYLGLRQLYAWWIWLPHQKFQPLVDPSNQVSTLLGSHWIAMEQIMAVICQTERKAAAKMPNQNSDGDIGLGNIRWLKYLNAHVDPEHQAYNQWPVWVEAQLDRNIGFFGKTN